MSSEAELPFGEPELLAAAPERQWEYAPLSTAQVRWYWYKAAFSPVGLRSLPVVPHRGDLWRYCEADSLRLEEDYRASEAKLEREWWDEQAAIAQGEWECPDAALPSDWSTFLTSSAASVPAAPAAAPAPTPVRSGAYEVSLARRLMSPCYWPEAAHRVLRGTWFAEKAAGEWVPLTTALAEQVEGFYRSAVWDPVKGRLESFAFPPLRAARCELAVPGERPLEALFASSEEAWICQEGALAWLGRRLAKPTRWRLRRGYAAPPARAALDKESDSGAEARDERAAKTPVTRLVLAVHGIGQSLDNADIAADATSFRSVLQQVAQDGGLGEAGDEGRTEVLPVQWRKALQLELDDLSRHLMPTSILPLRQMLHATVVEVLLYFTPLHKRHVFESLLAALNGQYAAFLRRNPEFSGSVSIMAHSLGSVLVYDVLCNQRPAPELGVGGVGAGGAEEQEQGVAGAEEGQGVAGTEEGQEEAAMGSLPLADGDASMASLPAVVDSSPAVAASSPAADGDATMASSPKPHPNPELISPGTSASDPVTLEPPPPSRPPTLQPASLADPSGVQVSIPQLAFTVDRLILLGSPLGIFLALRGVSCESGVGLGSAAAAPLMQSAARQSGPADGLPAVRRLYNLYHPCDPVGHRLEPLAFGVAASRRPPYIPLLGNSRRLHVGLTELQEDVSSAASRLGASLLDSFSWRKKGDAAGTVEEEGGDGAAALEQSRNVLASDASLTFGASPKNAGAALARSVAAASAVRSPTRPRPATQAPSVVPAKSLRRIAAGEWDPDARAAKGRLDFAVQEHTLSNQYISALSAHFIYWSSPDVALFVLRAVHGLDVLTGEAVNDDCA